MISPPRLHLFELEDQPWLPTVVRQGMVDSLRFFFNKLGVYQSTAPAVCELLQHAGETEVLDLCSGGGGEAEKVIELVRKSGFKQARMLLSDLYPNLPAYQFLEQKTNGALGFIRLPVNALQVPEVLPRVRTLYTAFHHFTPAQAQELLTKAAAGKWHLGIFEATSRNWLNLLLLLPQPFVLLLATPFIKPFTFSRLFFTYLVPLIPLGVLWDGLVSMFRLYTVKELKQMTAAAARPGYTWEVRQVRHWLGVQTVQILGMPSGNKTM